MKNQEIINRLGSLRAGMKANGLQAYIVPTADPHGSEYVCDHWKVREWTSGFTGSAGTLVVTLEKAALWVDSRYYLQADIELEGTTINSLRVVVIENFAIAEWLNESLQEGDAVGIDARLTTSSDVEELSRVLARKEVVLRTDYDPFPEIWNDRPQLPLQPVFRFTEHYAGTHSEEKLSVLRSIVSENGAKGIFLTDLYEIAWLLNLRGKDVAYNPVAISFAYVSNRKTVLFIDDRKMTDEVSRYLDSLDVEVKPYEDVYGFAASLNRVCLMIDKGKTNYKLIQSLPTNCPVLFAPSPVALLKASKNDVEIEGERRAMVKDGVALVKFVRWLTANVASGEITEVTVADKLLEFKQQLEGFVCESFNTIAGYGPNGAIVHYSASPQSARTLQPEGFLLLDCGSQYYDGTTDITRTLKLGTLTQQERLDYTNVLKGHIAIATVQFPEGTRGAQLDVLARRSLWMNGANYLHGTGHGVGHFLSVHEGPQNIRMNENPVQLVPGMILSNEPGVYRAGSHGVRIENLVLVVPALTNEFGAFFRFETLSLFPYEKEAIETSILTAEEVEYINNYHQTVFNTLAPLLNEEERAWLKEKTTPIYC